jgi:hypothetical protein
MKKILLILVVLALSLEARDLYDAMKGNVIPLNMNNYKK